MSEMALAELHANVGKSDQVKLATLQDDARRLLCTLGKCDVREFFFSMLSRWQEWIERGIREKDFVPLRAVISDARAWGYFAFGRSADFPVLMDLDLLRLEMLAVLQLAMFDGGSLTTTEVVNEIRRESCECNIPISLQGNTEISGLECLIRKSEGGIPAPPKRETHIRKEIPSSKARASTWLKTAESSVKFPRGKGSVCKLILDHQEEIRLLGIEYMESYLGLKDGVLRGCERDAEDVMSSVENHTPFDKVSNSLGLNLVEPCEDQGLETARKVLRSVGKVMNYETQGRGVTICFEDDMPQFGNTSVSMGMADRLGEGLCGFVNAGTGMAKLQIYEEKDGILTLADEKKGITFKISELMKLASDDLSLARKHLYEGIQFDWRGCKPRMFVTGATREMIAEKPELMRTLRNLLDGIVDYELDHLVLSGEFEGMMELRAAKRFYSQLWSEKNPHLKVVASLGIGRGSTQWATDEGIVSIPLGMDARNQTEELASRLAGVICRQRHLLKEWGQDQNCVISLKSGFKLCLNESPQSLASILAFRVSSDDEPEEDYVKARFRILPITGKVHIEDLELGPLDAIYVSKQEYPGAELAIVGAAGQALSISSSILEGKIPAEEKVQEWMKDEREYLCLRQGAILRRAINTRRTLKDCINQIRGETRVASLTQEARKVPFRWKGRRSLVRIIDPGGQVTDLPVTMTFGNPEEEEDEDPGG